MIRELWQKALADAGLTKVDDQDAITITEFGALMGLKREAARAKLDALVAAGKASRTQKLTVTQHGRMFSAVAYRLLHTKGARSDVPQRSGNARRLRRHPAR